MCIGLTSEVARSARRSHIPARLPRSPTIGKLLSTKAPTQSLTTNLMLAGMNTVQMIAVPITSILPLWRMPRLAQNCRRSRRKRRISAKQGLLWKRWSLEAKKTWLLWSIKRRPCDLKSSQFASRPGMTTPKQRSRTSLPWGLRSKYTYTICLHWKLKYAVCGL